MDKNEVYLYIAGIHKHIKDLDFVKNIKRLVPNYEDFVLGIFKKCNTACLTVRWWQ